MTDPAAPQTSATEPLQFVPPASSAEIARFRASLAPDLGPATQANSHHPTSLAATLTPGGGLHRLAITSVFGDALHPRTWSGAPRNLADGLRSFGVQIDSIYPAIGRPRLAYYAALHSLAGYGSPRRAELVFRNGLTRRRRAALVKQQAVALGVDRVLHTGSFDLPVAAGDTAKHYLYCDHTWNLAAQFWPDDDRLSPRALAHFEALEAETYAGLRHIFTFGNYVRQNLIDHYGVPADRVTAVGSGMGQIEPFTGPKDYQHGHLLFVAKHLFRNKGGLLLLDAFARARRRRPDLQLVVVANQRDLPASERDDGIRVVNSLPWYILQGLYRSAALLVQPMLNDPWGQVYLEALASRTPVMGLDRNGLPEIVDNDRHGFLVREPDPELFAQAILEAMSDPDRLAAMGGRGQQHVIENYSWRRVAESIVRTIEAE